MTKCWFATSPTARPRNLQTDKFQILLLDWYTVTLKAYNVCVSFKPFAGSFASSPLDLHTKITNDVRWQFFRVVCSMTMHFNPWFIMRSADVEWKSLLVLINQRFYYENLLLSALFDLRRVLFANFNSIFHRFPFFVYQWTLAASEMFVFFFCTGKLDTVDGSIFIWQHLCQHDPQTVYTSGITYSPSSKCQSRKYRKF